MKNLMKNMLAQLRNGRRVAGLLLLLGVLVACGEDPRQLFETAQFEEQQRNRVHAQELYEQIIQQHPDSEYAGKARERLAALKAEHPEGEVQEIQ
jgi:outer membrane protein assembly factor BamD (BamD/ComL family)